MGGWGGEVGTGGVWAWLGQLSMCVGCRWCCGRGSLGPGGGVVVVVVVVVLVLNMSQQDCMHIVTANETAPSNSPAMHAPRDTP